MLGLFLILYLIPYSLWEQVKKKNFFFAFKWRRGDTSWCGDSFAVSIFVIILIDFDQSETAGLSTGEFQGFFSTYFKGKCCKAATDAEEQGWTWFKGWNPAHSRICLRRKVSPKKPIFQRTAKTISFKWFSSICTTGRFTEPTGSLISPFWPNNYFNSETCFYDVMSGP